MCLPFPARLKGSRDSRTGPHPTPCFSGVCSPLLSPEPDLLWDLSDLGLLSFHAVLRSGVWDVATFRKFLGAFMCIEMCFSWNSCTHPSTIQPLLLLLENNPFESRGEE